MALTHAQLAMLALRTAGALHYDLRNKPFLDHRGRLELSLRADHNETKAKGVELEVQDYGTLISFLVQYATSLEASIAESPETDAVKGAVADVVSSMRALIGTLTADQDGDGPSNGLCGCGLMPFARAVEAHVTSAYEEAGAFLDCPAHGHEAVVPPLVVYRTSVVRIGSQKTGPFNVAGTADISTAPGEISLLIKNSQLFAQDLWQLAYIIHHELICHGFQYAAALRATPDNNTMPVRKNAPAGCHWTEGWMDAVAFALATRWAKGADCRACCGFGGSMAASSMGDVHKTRYPDPTAIDLAVPPDLGVDDAFRRLCARQAFEALVAVLDMVNDDAEAKDAAIAFSLRLNAHKEVTPEALMAISGCLQGALLGDIRADAATQAAAACLEFAADGNIYRLAAGLGGRPTAPATPADGRA